MTAELMAIITLTCSDLQGADQAACEKSLEAYAVQSNWDTSVSKFNTYAEKETEKKVSKPIMVVTAVGAKYAATKRAQYTLKSSSGFFVGGDKSRDDARGLTGITWEF